MPRIPEPRTPGRVSTTRQLERQRAILRAAGRLGAEHGLERVQMSEVAHTAGVALGTLYRYYPSKHHLFAAVLDTAVRELPHPAGVSTDPVTGAADFLSRAIGELLRHPHLARAMLVSMNAVRAEKSASPVVAQDYSMPERILAAAGITTPTTEDHRLARLLEQCVYGILTWTTAGNLTTDQAMADVHRACELLLAPWRSSR
ncbi:TetR family transcriptional regulator [Nocardia aurantiaca]|uniref:TetR family transcriptional regulator n=1 Tax=Nocardia aurantiaca TaxID=2675850 RepID=A0A6I3KYP0_9NOCA|nr:TetR family transcriptional regulator [Nocardia aurantiaca]MTE14068.1 TetR family transcriptional regulator [Nocardia aurantiaca]